MMAASDDDEEVLLRSVGLRNAQSILQARRRAEEALRYSEQLHRVSFDLAPTGMVYIGHDGRFAKVNETMCQITGYTADELMRMKIPDLTHSDDRLRNADLLDAFLRGDMAIYENENRYVRKDGGIRWVAVTARMVPGADGRPLHAIGVIQDITDRKAAQEQLRESENRFHVALQHSPIAVYTSDLDLRYTWVHNPQFGFSSEQMIGKKDEELLPPLSMMELIALKRHVVEIGKGDHRQIKVPVAGGISTFDVTAEPLRDSAGAIQGVILAAIDVSQIVAAKAAAEAANEAKSQFLANISHELRTPMNAILGMIELALPKEVDATTRDYLTTARESADLLLSLLNDLLDSAKIEAGKLELEEAPFSLRRTLEQITRVLSVRAQEKGLVFYSRWPDDMPDAVVGDKMRLRQVLLNLAGNAIKFTTRGEVTVNVTVDSLINEEVHLHFAIRDTGIGIPGGEIERIFEPFAQADTTTARRFGGTGLGLSISSNLTSLMGGRVWAQSQLGQGSVFHFTVRLPLAKLPLATDKPLRDVAAAPATALRILLVEDNPANQKVATYILRERGHMVEVASDGQEAVRMFDENDYDAILMDVQMPGMGGFEATQAIRVKENGAKRMPIIAMTASAMKGDREKCLIAEMDAYLSKPIDRNELVALVESLVAESRSCAASQASR